MTLESVWGTVASCWAALWAAVVSWRWGDIAAWVGAAVNFGVVLVALSPVRTAKRERAARGRLVAAYLAFPMSLTRMTLARGRTDMALLLDPNADMAKQDAALKRFGEIPDSVRGMLARFEVSDAAYLDNGMGEKLAQSFGAVNAAAMSVPIVVKVFTRVRKLRASGNVQQNLALVEHARTVSAQLDDVFDVAVKRLSVFTDYCTDLGFLGQGSKGKG